MSLIKRLVYPIRVKLRTKRLKYILPIIDDVFEKKGCVNILDIGGTKTYWKLLPKEILEDKNVFITILNLPAENKPKDEKRFKHIEGDGCNISGMDDNSFDITYSNSVIEHVGNWDKMLQLSRELKRLAKRYYIQTPCFWFPIEPHCMTLFFHWLPKPIRVTLVMKLSLGSWSRQETIDQAIRKVESINLLDKRMFRELFKDADIKVERVLLLPKSLIAIRYI